MKKLSILFLFALMFNLTSFAEEEVYLVNVNTPTQQEEQIEPKDNIFAIFRRTKNNQEEIPVVQTKAINIDKQELEKRLILYKTTKQTNSMFP